MHTYFARRLHHAASAPRSSDRAYKMHTLPFMLPHQQSQEPPPPPPHGHARRANGSRELSTFWLPRKWEPRWRAHQALPRRACRMSVRSLSISKDQMSAPVTSTYPTGLRDTNTMLTTPPPGAKVSTTTSLTIGCHIQRTDDLSKRLRWKVGLFGLRPGPASLSCRARRCVALPSQSSQTAPCCTMTAIEEQLKSKTIDMCYVSATWASFARARLSFCCSRSSSAPRCRWKRVRRASAACLRAWSCSSSRLSSCL